MIAVEIGEKMIDYHDWREELAKCTVGDFGNFRELFSTYAGVEKSPLHRATYVLGSFLQDHPDGNDWDDGSIPGDATPPLEPPRELLHRAVLHAVYYLAFDDMRVGGGSPPREKARNLEPKLKRCIERRRSCGIEFSWLDKMLHAGGYLCAAVQAKEKSVREELAESCVDTVMRARVA